MRASFAFLPCESRRAERLHLFGVPTVRRIDLFTLLSFGKYRKSIFLELQKFEERGGRFGRRGHGVAARLEEYEIAGTLDVIPADGAEKLFGFGALGHDLADAFEVVSGVFEGGGAGGLREPVEVVAVADPVENLYYGRARRKPSRRAFPRAPSPWTTCPRLSDFRTF